MNIQKQQPPRIKNKIRGWKNIAAYMGFCPSAVRQWARTDPTLRIKIKKIRGVIFADAHDLDSWIESASTTLGG